MKVWTIVALAIAAVCVAAGIGLRGLGDGWVGVSTFLVVCGGSATCVCIALWAAYALGLGRPVSEARSARLQRLADDLLDAAKTADVDGVLALSKARVAERQTLFACGVEMLVSAESPEIMQAALQNQADMEANEACAAAHRVLAMCRVLPLLALCTAFATTLWMIVSLRTQHLGLLTPIGLLVTVYGSFAIAAITSDYGQRAARTAAEAELSGTLVIQTILSIRRGDPVRVTEALLQRMMTPPATGHAPLRQAA